MCITMSNFLQVDTEVPEDRPDCYVVIVFLFKHGLFLLHTLCGLVCMQTPALKACSQYPLPPSGTYQSLSLSYDHF